METSILSQINPAHTLPSSYFMTHSILNYHLLQSLYSGLFPSVSLTKTLHEHHPHTCYIPCSFHPL
jgi:hypothetical protein